MVYNLLVILGFFGYFLAKGRRKGGPKFVEKIGLKGLEKLPAGECYWFHAVSLGEMKALYPFAERFKGTGRPLIFSTQTKTGYEEAVRAFPEAHHIYLPLDTSWAVKKIFKRVKPLAIFITESDFWKNFLKEGRKSGAKIILVNGKLSEKSLRRYRFFSKFSASLFKEIDLFLLQNSLYLERFSGLGIPREKCKVTGNLKIRVPTIRREIKREELSVSDREFLVVIGSTHPGEEALLLKQLEVLLEKEPRLKIAFVPRHPERFDEVFQFLKKAPYKVGRFTDGIKSDDRVLLIDQMGILTAFYAVADVAVVAGSFVDHVGGHHLLEPALLGVPALFGPHTFTQEEFRTLALHYGAGIEVKANELAPTIQKLLTDQQFSTKMREAGTQLLKKEAGAAERSLREIEQFGIVLSSDRSRGGAGVSSLGS